MLYILGCFTTILLFAVILLFSLFRGFFRLFFRSNSSGTNQSQQNRTYQTSDTGSQTRTQSGSGYSSPTSRKKIIAEDEGEYVDFEEVKD